MAYPWLSGIYCRQAQFLMALIEVHDAKHQSWQLSEILCGNMSAKRVLLSGRTHALSRVSVKKKLKLILDLKRRLRAHYRNLVSAFSLSKNLHILHLYFLCAFSTLKHQSYTIQNKFKIRAIGLKSAGKQAVFFVFSKKRDALAKRACCAKRVHQYSFCALSRAFLSQAQLVAASAELSELHSLSSQHLVKFLKKSKNSATCRLAQILVAHVAKRWCFFYKGQLSGPCLAKRPMPSKKRKSVELDEFKVELERRNYHKRLTNLADSSIDLALVKEFYANLYSPEGLSPKQVRIRGHLIKIDADSLNAFLETHVVLAEGCLLTSGKLRMLCAYPAEGHPGKILRKDLTTLAQVWSVLSYSNLAPTSHTSDLTVDRARLIFGLVTQLDMNVRALISGQITSMAQSNSFRLGFPALITTLCRSRGVASDSLVFERLSPVINLAYIRKNCWNPDDPTVIIRGARRPRARPIEAASTLVAPHPASTSSAPPPARMIAAPSTLPLADFQCFEAMLRSIHQGKIILLQSLQLVAPPDSILTIEQFNEWGLSLLFTGKTKIPPLSLEPLIRKRMVVVTQEAAATSEKSLEATLEPPAPLADTTSP
ncbi:hypothetical protein HKD37_04G010251 [Glycine soja]